MASHPNPYCRRAASKRRTGNDDDTEITMKTKRYESRTPRATCAVAAAAMAALTLALAVVLPANLDERRYGPAFPASAAAVPHVGAAAATTPVERIDVIALRGLATREPASRLI
jgi:hypothetical protein